MDAAPPTGPFRPALPHELGEYVLLEEIGQGGMGIIYKARQCCLDRLCAVKMLRTGPTPAGPEAETALRAEAAAAARLDHPNIVGIYEVGRAEGRLFFSMEFVPGEDLGRYVRSRILPPRTIAALMHKIAGAIAYAHARGVMHHDLKPANVVIDPEGEPQVTDFGLAQRIGEAHRADPTRGVGSPNYLAPEQASARFGDPGPLTDVFGLGAILYFLLTDRPPFMGVTLEDTIEAVLRTDPIDPRSLRQGIPLDLATICLKCLSKSPSRRYASVREVAEELDRFLGDEPILARPAGLLERGRRLCRRHPVIAGLGATVAILISLLALGASVAAYRINEAREQAETSERSARHHLYNADLLLAADAFADGQDGQVRRLLRNHIPTTNAIGAYDLRGWEWWFLTHASQGDTAGTLGTHTSAVVQLTPSRDGRLLLASDVGGSLAVWDLIHPPRQLASRSLAPVGAPLVALAHTSNLALVVQRSAEGTNDVALILSLPTLDTRREFPLSGRNVAGAWTPDDRAVWILGLDAITRLDVETGTPTLNHPVDRARRSIDFAFSPDGRWLAFATGDDRIGFLDLVHGGTELKLGGHTPNPVWGASCNTLQFSPDSRRLVTAGSDGTVRLWSVDPPAPLHAIPGHADLVTAATFTPDASAIVSTGRDGFLMVTPLDPEGRPQETVRLRGAEPVQTSVTVHPTTREPISAGIDGTIHRWRSSPRDRMPTLTGFPAGVADLTPLADGNHFAARHGESGIRVGRISDGKPVYSLDPPPGIATATVEFPPGETLFLATLDAAGEVAIQRALAPDPVRTHRRLDRPPTSRRTAQLFFARDARFLAVADMARGTEILTTSNLATLLQVEGRPQQIAFSPSGHWIAIGEVGGAIRVADLTRPQSEPRDWMHPQHSGLAFSAAEDRLASVAYDGSICLWDLASGRVVARVEAGISHLLSVSWSADGRRLFTGNLSGTLSVWDLTTLRETLVLRLHSQPITGLHQRPDRSLQTFGPDAIRTWLAPEP